MMRKGKTDQVQTKAEIKRYFPALFIVKHTLPEAHSKTDLAVNQHSNVFSTQQQKA